MRGIIATGDVDPRDLVERAQGLPSMEGSDLVLGVTCEQAFDWAPATPLAEDEFAPPALRKKRRNLRVAAYDFGMKWNILRRFTAYGCDVRVFPATTPASELIAAGPDGVFLSNGPGDPAVLSYAIVERAARWWTRRSRCSASASATRSCRSRWAATPTS